MGQAELAAELLHRLLWAHEASYSPGFVQAACGCWPAHSHRPTGLFSRASQARRGARPSRLRQGCPISRDPLSRPHHPTKALLWLDPLRYARSSRILSGRIRSTTRRRATRAKLPGWHGRSPWRTGDERAPSAATCRDARHRARRQWRWQRWLLFIVLRSHHHALVDGVAQLARRSSPSRHASRVPQAARAPPPPQSSPRDGRPLTRERSASSSVRVEAQAATRPSAISRHYTGSARPSCGTSRPNASNGCRRWRRRSQRSLRLL